MADDMERTEEATPRRREQAQEEGRFAKSQELAVAATLLGSALVLTSVMPLLGVALRDLMGGSLASLHAVTPTPDGIAALVRLSAGKTMAATAAVLASLAATGIALSILQAKGTFSLKPLEPKFERIDPLKNAKNLLSTRQLVELVKSLAKLALVGAAVYASLRRAMPDAAALAQQEPIGLVHFVQRNAVRLLLTAGGAYLVLAVADYLWQWWQFEKGLRMSKEEVKQEHKESEGDPHIKQRRKTIARQYARRQMLQDVQSADVVVVNPVHIAVAIRYDPTSAPAPVVVAMGKLLLAERIKELAAAAGVPIVENRPVARALIKSARVGTIIPVELYVAVAEILAFVIRSRATRGSWAGSARA
ncbi:MAG TPA: EscU/YscU/HrcU family type III secretion system export apparatus switch protein [Gemmatimonadaceae bacterium]|nr:EscU/YscU/HrcU family type III secretion system export apparatus switch protein [Gemmatimonadaceae bacterium]